MKLLKTKIKLISMFIQMNFFQSISLYFRKRNPVIRPLIRKSYNFLRHREQVRSARKVNSFFYSRARQPSINRSSNY